MKKEKVAIKVTEFVFGASGMPNAQYPCVIPVSRIAKVRGHITEGSLPEVIKQRPYNTTITLRTPAETMLVMETPEIIEALMNGGTLETLGSKFFDCKHAGAVHVNVFEPFRRNDESVLRLTGKAKLCEACQSAVNDNPADPRQVRVIGAE